ncbi:winged helix-turn-helix domain-containing protein [Saliphagus sp. LR7]|uniref:helix-turn-helix transcriptional regulator n=1 Tax=Saliphagus sp. LR7 TaxID=2282654 RepID=UPI000DF7C297|nr:MarR family transcriptional regulator [Saliphagus sp. LR7]
MDTERLIELVRRGPVLEALLEEGTMDRREIERRLGVSRSTVHRSTGSLRDSGLVERTDGAFSLTPLGEVCAREVTGLERTVGTAWEIAPILRAARDHDIALDVETFVDATVTTAAPGNPYRPVARFMSLLEDTDTLRGLDPASINPLHIDELCDRIADGMVTEAVFPSAVLEELLVSNPERARTVVESGNLVLLAHDDLPFGLTICDDRVGVGVYDDETGLLRTYVDTDSPAARDWADAVFAEYRSAATTLVEHDELSEFPSARAMAEDGSG